ncbi:MAG: hypothetical protein RH982_16590 [Parvibaculum sp.]
MLKNLFAVFALAAGLVLAPAAFVAAPAMAQDVEAVAAMQLDIEALILANAGDAEALALAIEEYVVASGNPEAATQAVINALTNPLNDAVRQALIDNPDLKIAAAEGLGAAIAVIALTDPTAAANMLALVEASGDATLIASVNDGNAEKTASIETGGVDTGEDAVEEQNETSENPASAN